MSLCNRFFCQNKEKDIVCNNCKTFMCNICAIPIKRKKIIKWLCPDCFTLLLMRETEKLFKGNYDEQILKFIHGDYDKKIVSYLFDSKIPKRKIDTIKKVNINKLSIPVENG